MHLDESSATPLYRQIYEQIHEGIINGTYPQGSKLPSIRGLADELHCARNTIESAYGMLVEEGLIASRPGSGYVVQDATHLTLNTAKPEALLPLLGEESHVRYDFTYGNLERGTFPAATWRSIVDDLLLSIESRMCDVYSDPFGEEALRTEIAWRLNTLRDVDCTPSQVIIQGGTATSIQNLLTLFNAAEDGVAMEEPGYQGVREVFERSAFTVNPCRISDNYEQYFADLETYRPKLVYVTPSSQFPTCQVMPIKTRARLIAWAEANDAYLLEDDYCRDFRYVERPLPPLQSMDQSGRVVYMGTFSKSLSPALRMNYLVLPPALLDTWRQTFKESHAAVPWLSQAALARFMGDGHWDRHLRKLQVRNKRKYLKLIGALEQTMGDKIHILENGTGLHLLVDVLDGRSQQELLALARAADVAIYDTNKYWMAEDHPLKSCVLIGFSAIAEEDIEPGIEALAQAWFGEE